MLISHRVSTSTRWRCWWLRVAVLRAGEVWAACSGPPLMMSPVKITDCTALQPTRFLSQLCGKEIRPAQIIVHAGPITGLRWAICPAPCFVVVVFVWFWVFPCLQTSRRAVSITLALLQPGCLHCMGESHIRMIHLLPPLSLTNGQRSIPPPSTLHQDRKFKGRW